MPCTSTAFTQLGSDALNGTAGPLSASWVSPIEVGHAIVLNGTSAYGNGTVGGEAKWIGTVVPQDQYAEIQMQASAAGAYVDLYLRRDPTNASAYWFFSWDGIGSTNAFVLDNLGSFSDNYQLSSPLAQGNKLRVSAFGLQACIWRDTGSGYVLEHSTTLPAILPTGGTVAGQSGFGLSGQGLANNFATGSVTSISLCALSGTFQYPNGSRVANGKLYLRLSQDAQITNGGGQLTGGTYVVVNLDTNGSIPAGTSIWGNDNLIPTGTTYKCSVTSPGGALVWGLETVSITGSSFNFNSFAPPLPQDVGRP